jgi:two-component system sensor histidine kinase KdpD
MADSEPTSIRSSEPAREARGKLRIFLGASPGVGKTFAMVQAARLRLRDGVDVVAGLVDTHGLKETTDLLVALECVPAKQVTIGTRILAELDIDAVLKRRPQLVLIDDLAHANPPASWHAHRYQDVEQILDSGIDVYATLNIQHVESLTDIVAQVARVDVRNTVPDAFVQKADEIELIDLPPAEILARLKQGKVFVPEEDRASMNQYFSDGTLTALRELALRHMADRVDQQMLQHRRAHSISGIWPTRERIMVCVGEAEVVSRLIRLTKRAAERRKVPWIALYVETHNHQSYSLEQRTRINDAMRLAEQLGAETVTLAGEDAATEILNYAATRNVTQIIIGRSERPRWIAAFVPSVTDKLLHQKNNIDILVVTPEKHSVRDDPDATPAPVEHQKIRWRGYLQAVHALAWATAINFAFSELGWFHNFAVIYLTAVILVAIRQGRWPALFAAVMTAPIYHFFFVEPKYQLSKIYNIDPISLLVFLTATVIISNLAERVRAQIRATRLSERRSNNLYDFNRKIAGAANLDDVLWAVVHHVASTLGGKSMVMMTPRGKPSADRLEIVAAYPPEMTLDDMSDAAADWAWRQGKPAGRGSHTLPGAEWMFIPLKTARGTLGVVGVQIEDHSRLPSSEESRLLETLADQAAIAIERTHLVSEFEETRLFMETERLRSALLSSLSHDLRTPLVSILGSATTLIDLEADLEIEARRDLLETIREEAERLNRFVQNLLDMTRLGTGALRPKQEWIEIGDVIGAAVRRLRRQLGTRTVDIAIDPGLPLVSLDFMLIEQVLVNLIDNACKYSLPTSRLELRAARAGGSVAISVCDEGLGIPAFERALVFDMFYRVKATDSQTAGTGLGLAICRGIVEAHGGTISIADGIGGQGTCVTFTLPILDVPTLTETETGDDA